jgi:hypothetical protein
MTGLRAGVVAARERVGTRLRTGKISSWCRTTGRAWVALVATRPRRRRVPAIAAQRDRDGTGRTRTRVAKLGAPVVAAREDPVTHPATGAPHVWLAASDRVGGGAAVARPRGEHDGARWAGAWVAGVGASVRTVCAVARAAAGVAAGMRGQVARALGVAHLAAEAPILGRHVRLAALTARAAPPFAAAAAAGLA